MAEWAAGAGYDKTPIGPGSGSQLTISCEHIKKLLNALNTTRGHVMALEVFDFYLFCTVACKAFPSIRFTFFRSHFQYKFLMPFTHFVSIISPTVQSADILQENECERRPKLVTAAGSQREWVARDFNFFAKKKHSNEFALPSVSDSITYLECDAA